jgi:hypothetical protein
MKVVKSFRTICSTMFRMGIVRESRVERIGAC